MGNDLTFSKKMLQLMSDSDRQEPVRLPKGSWLPFPRNPAFAMREDPLQALISLLMYEDSEEIADHQQPVAIVGPDGSGKTQLALELCYRSAQFFGGVQWIDAQRNSYLMACIVNNAQAKNLPNFSNMIQEQARSILDTWRTTRRLVVLDNLEEPERIPDLMKHLENVQVLITAPSDRWLKESGVRVYTLEVLESKEALQLLRKTAPRLKKEKDSDLEQVCQAAGYFPQALALAGNYLKVHSGESVKGYLAKLQKGIENPDSRLEGWVSQSSLNSTPALASIFIHSLESLDAKKEQGQLARQILAIAGYCAPDMPIPINILRKATGTMEANQGLFERALLDLYHYGLLVNTEEGPVIHRLKGEMARCIESGNDNAVARLAESMTAFGKLFERRPLRESILMCAHYEFALPFIEKAELKQASRLWGILGYENWMVGSLSRAKDSYERAIYLGEKLSGPEIYRLAAEYYNLGRVLVDNNEYLAAKESFIKATEISSDYKVATELFNLGNLLAKQYKFREAKDCLERASTIIDQSYGQDYPQYATYISHLGEILYQLDEFEEAKVYIERVLKIHEKAYSNKPNHTQLAIDYSLLAQILKRMGDLQGAKTCFERALAINEDPLNRGQYLLQVARDVNNLGRVLYALGDLENALACFERFLKINERSRGLDLSDVTKALINMGLTLKELGRTQEAVPYFEKAMAIDEVVYTSNDSSVASDVHRLGVALRSMGDLPKAKACFERAVELEERVHGPDHANVATNLHHLARVLQEMKDLPTARGCYERALEIDRKKYGPQHSYVATDINDLGSLLQDMRDLEGAKSCFMQALKIDEMVHGPEHPNVARDINNLASVQKAMGDLQGALASFTQAANIFEMFYGADHPKTKIVRQNQENVRRRMQLKK